MLLADNMAFFDVPNFSCIDDVIKESDVIYMLRMQFERISRRFYPSIKEYNKFFTMNIDRLNNMPSGSILMHPGPVNREVEIMGEILDMEKDNMDKIKKCSKLSSNKRT